MQGCLLVFGMFVRDSEWSDFYTDLWIVVWLPVLVSLHNGSVCGFVATGCESEFRLYIWSGSCPFSLSLFTDKL